MELKDKYLLVIFILLLVVLGLALYEIYNFMPVFDSCKDDFKIIEKCKCIPWENSLTFPQFIKYRVLIRDGL